MSEECTRGCCPRQRPILIPIDPDPSPAPIKLRLSVALSEEQRAALRRALNALHGYPDGIPLDAPAPAELVEAHYRISRARLDLDIEVRVDRDGSLAVVGVCGGAPTVPIDVATKDELRVSEAYRTSQPGDVLPAYARAPR